MELSVTASHHQLSMTVLERSTGVSVAIFLAIDDSTLNRFLNLKSHQNHTCTSVGHVRLNIKTPRIWTGLPTSLRRMQCTMTITKPSRESKTAKRIWNRAERRSVMARTADIQVSASRGKTTQELHSDAL